MDSSEALPPAVAVCALRRIRASPPPLPAHTTGPNSRATVPTHLCRGALSPPTPLLLHPHTLGPSPPASHLVLLPGKHLFPAPPTSPSLCETALLPAHAAASNRRPSFPRCSLLLPSD